MASSTLAILEAQQLYRQRRNEEARALGEQILEADPQHGDALYLLAQMASERSAHDEAARLLTRLLMHRSDDATIHLNLGNALQRLGHMVQAIEQFRKALLLQPKYASAHFNLGNVFRDMDILNQAVEHYRRAIQLQPRYAEAQNNLGSALRARGDVDDASRCFQRALTIRDNYPSAHYNLANAYQAQGKLSRAMRHYRRAIDLDHRLSSAHANLGLILEASGELDRAIQSYEEALRLEPNSADHHSNLGSALRLRGRLDEAVEHLRQAVQLEPHHTHAWANLGSALKDLGQFDEAMKCFRRGLKTNPDHHGAHSSLLFSLNFHPTISRKTVFEEHRRWGERHTANIAVDTHWPNVPDPDRPLRVGYVSPDFRSHAVAHFIGPVLAKHDATTIESHCYADVPAPDKATQRLQSLAHRWRDIFGLPDEQVAQLIRDDQIDLLVDLAGHSKGHRLLVFARKPAPVQITFLGYPNTTGLDTVDYRVTDAVADPPGRDDSYTEQLVRLEHGFTCYAPAGNVPPVNQPPATSKGYVTFGCLNNIAKLNDKVIELWAKLLQANPRSRLLLYRNTIRLGVKQRLRDRFAQFGLDPDRIETYNMTPRDQSHLVLYRNIDIALDTFPWNGHATTCEALWMGVPVVTLLGRSHAGRMASSVLTMCGLEHLIASSEEQYIQIATRLAADRERLARLRESLRHQVATSKLCDAQGFTACLERAYRQMWRDWCNRGGRR